MGWRAGSLLICCLPSFLKLARKQRPQCLLPATPMWRRGRAIWGYGNVHQSLQFSKCARYRLNGCKEQKSKCLSEKHSNMLNDWKIIMYSQLIISRIAADWEYNQDSRFVFASFLTGCWQRKTHLQGCLWNQNLFVFRFCVTFQNAVCVSIIFALDITIHFKYAHP